MKFIFKKFLNSLLSEYYPDDSEKVIVLLDEFSHLCEYFDKLEGSIELSLDQNQLFSFYPIKTIDEFLETTREFDTTTGNLIFYLTNKSQFNKISRLNENELDIRCKKIYTQNILAFCCDELHSEVDWGLTLRYFRIYLPKIAGFLVNNITQVQNIFQRGIETRLKREFMIYIYFKDIPNMSEWDQTEKKKFYILEKILWHGKELEKLSQSLAHELYTFFSNYLSTAFSAEITKFLRYFIENNKTEDLINFCILMKLITDLEKDIEFEDYKEFAEKITPPEQRIDLEIEDDDGVLIFTESVYNEFKPVIINFFNLKIRSNRFLIITPLVEKYKNAKLILNIEKKFHFFPNRLEIDKNITQEIYSLTKLNTVYSGIVRFSQVFFQNFFEITGDELTRRIKTISLISQYTYFIDRFKQNIYYKINLKEYKLFYNFLKNVIQLFLLLRDLDDIDEDSIISYNLEGWQKFYINFLLPIDNLCWSTFENSRLFWAFEELSRYMLLLSENVVTKIKEINKLFIDFLKSNYPTWVQDGTLDSPITVVNVIKKFFAPDKREYRENHVDYFLFIIIDCCRTDIWEQLRYYILEDFPELGSKSKIGMSILPTSTKFARRAIFTGKYPKDQSTFTQSNEAEEALSFFRANYASTFSRIRRLTTTSDIKKFYTVNSELLDNNNIAIENISNDQNFQICIFNFPDTISHNFEISMNSKILNIIYEDKIKPIIRKVLELKNNPVIFFGTDHGIVKCRDKIDWHLSSFNEHWKYSNKEDHIYRKNRYFVSKIKLLRYIGQDLLVINNNFNNWGLPPIYREPWVKALTGISSYSFGIAYNDLLGAYGANSKKYAHGGASFFEMFIPFAILSKNLLNDVVPEDPLVELSVPRNSIKITNSNHNTIKIKKIHFKISHYHYIYINKELAGNETIYLQLNIPNISESEFYTKMEYEYNERLYIYKDYV